MGVWGRVVVWLSHRVVGIITSTNQAAAARTFAIKISSPPPMSRVLVVMAKVGLSVRKNL